MAEPDPIDIEDDQSPIQQSIEIHRRRIAAILDRMIEKLSVGCCLHKLKAEIDHSLAGKLTKKQYMSLMKLGRSVHKSSIASSLRSTTAKSKSNQNQKKSFSMEFSRDTHISIMISQLHHNADVMNAVNEFLMEMSPTERVFIDEIKEFKEYILDILHTTATAERQFNKQIGLSWVNNEKYKKRNAEMEKIHSSKLYELSFRINEKNNIISNYKNQIDQSHEKCIADLQKIINESEKSMSKTTLVSAERQELLAEEAKNITNQYQSLLEGHLSNEKAMRIKRYKIETVLAGWLAKYDQDIGDLQEQLEEQQNGYNSEKGAFDDLTEKSEYQLIDYEILMNEKAEEEQRIFDKKRYIFIANRSARIIQRWWRRLYNKHYKKKKGKGKKGKKK